MHLFSFVKVKLLTPQNILFKHIQVWRWLDQTLIEVHWVSNNPIDFISLQDCVEVPKDVVLKNFLVSNVLIFT